MPIRPTTATVAQYIAGDTLQENQNRGMKFEWYGGRGGEIGLIQGAYMKANRWDPRWFANFMFTTDAIRAPRESMRAHHVADAAIKRKVVEWINGGMNQASLLEAVEDVSSINTLAFPDIVFPEKVAAVWFQWLFGLLEALAVFLSSCAHAPCWISLWAAEKLVANMSSALANFRPGFGYTDGTGIAHAICPREATMPRLDVFNRALMSLAGFNSGNVAMESFWVGARYANTIRAMPHNAIQNPTLDSFFGDGGGRLYSSERRPGAPGALAIIEPNTTIAPTPADERKIREAVRIRNGIVTVASGLTGYAIWIYLLIPLFYSMMECMRLFPGGDQHEL